MPYCGPGKEDCVLNQTLKDGSCLVPCSGLHADIADVTYFRQNIAALEQNVMEGISFDTFISHELFFRFLHIES